MGLVCWRQAAYLCARRQHKSTRRRDHFRAVKTRRGLMLEYHKIQTVFLRDPATKYKTVLEGQFAKPEFEYLKQNTWMFTEKVDGTNIRVQWDDHVVLGGKTDHAHIPKFLLAKLQELFPVEAFLKWSAPALTLYGEGYGAKIQKGGGNYILDGCSFILFDVMVNGIWLERHNVEDIAHQLGIRVVPLIGQGTLFEAVDLVKHGHASELRHMPLEGLVMRPAIEMRDRRGERIIAKIKMRDFK
jgi:ATP-dependent RNA circularization protein (DNA/RNA ligase family)